MKQIFILTLLMTLAAQASVGKRSRPTVVFMKTGKPPILIMKMRMGKG